MQQSGLSYFFITPLTFSLSRLAQQYLSGWEERRACLAFPTCPATTRPPTPKPGCPSPTGSCLPQCSSPTLMRRRNQLPNATRGTSTHLIIFRSDPTIYHQREMTILCWKLYNCFTVKFVLKNYSFTLVLIRGEEG